MKQKFYTFFLILALSFLFVTNAKAGEREDKLVDLAMRGNVDGVKSLLDQGVDVNAKNSYGDTALVGACIAGQIDVVRLLLARGADINRAGNIGYTPLFEAVLQGNADIARILIDKGANVNKEDDLGDTALTWANKVLEKGQPGIDNSARVTYTPLTSAERESYLRIVQMLKAAGAK